MRRRGSSTVDGPFATLTFHRIYHHRPEHVWDALATPEGLRAWLMCTHAVIDGHVGGRFETVSGPSAFHSRGRILSWDPPRLLEYEWNVEPVPEMPKGERAIFRYELTAEGDATNLLVTYRRITRETARGFLPGLHAFLDRLEGQLDGSRLPSFQARFGELLGEYPEWSAHAADPGK